MSTISSLSSGRPDAPDFSRLPQNLFKQVDSDGDGAVSESEMSTLLEQSPRLARDLATLTGGEGTSADIFAALDEDGDGLVTADQFKTAVQEAREAGRANGPQGGPPPPPPEGGGPKEFSAVLEEVFAQGDSDGDGYLSEDDLSSLMSAIPGLKQDLTTLTGSDSVSASDAFSALDGDGDGKVSATEFTDAVSKAHEQTVASRTSTDSALLQAFLQRMQKQGYASDGGACSSHGSSVFSATA